jgi:hypothetical protein
MRTLVKLSVVPFAAALGFAGWSAWPDGPDPFADEITAARATWQAAGVDDYTITVERQCYCSPSEVTLIVEDGDVVAAVDPDGEPVEIHRVRHLTVDGLLDRAAEASADHHLAAFEVDPTLGYPTLIERPGDDGVDDSGSTYVVHVER